jgi:hypothetical protein
MGTAATTLLLEGLAQESMSVVSESATAVCIKLKREVKDYNQYKRCARLTDVVHAAAVYFQNLGCDEP